MKLKPPCIVKTDGTVEEYNPENGEEFTLEELQRAVGGYIEVVPFWGDPNSVMLANEEGLLIGLPINDKSMELVGKPLVGDLLVIPAEMMS